MVLTQTDDDDLKKPVVEQSHEPLVFISGNFTGASELWAIVEKEAFPIIEATTRLRHFLLNGQAFIIFTDHRKLTYILHPASRSTPTSKHTSDRLERWAARLQTKKSIFLVRRTYGLNSESMGAAGGNDRVLAIRPLHNEGFRWPNLEEIQAA